MASQFGHLSLELRDSVGVVVSADLYANIDDTKTLAAIFTEWTAVADAYDLLTDSVIQKAEMKVILPQHTGVWKDTPVAGGENERTALFNFSQTGSPYKYGVDIPAFKQALMTGGRVNLTATDVTSFITIMTTVGTALTFVSTAIRALVNLIDVLTSFRKHRKAEARRTVESPA